MSIIKEIATHEVEGYELDDSGVITTECKFRGQPYWVPWFWLRGLQGEAGFRVNEFGRYSWRLEVSEKDGERFGELKNAKEVRLWESDDRFGAGRYGSVKSEVVMRDLGQAPTITFEERQAK